MVAPSAVPAAAASADERLVLLDGSLVIGDLGELFDPAVKAMEVGEDEQSTVGAPLASSSAPAWKPTAAIRRQWETELASGRPSRGRARELRGWLRDFLH